MDGGHGGSGSSGNMFLHHRRSIKRDFSNMADSHRSGSPDSLFVSDDDHHHYSNHEQPASRLRMSNLALPPRRPPHYPGDGLDFRRPIMSGASREAQIQIPNVVLTPVIDLTDDDDLHTAATDPPTSAPAEVATVAATREQRPPRFGRNIIDLESEAEEEDHRRQSPADPAPRLPRPNYMSLFPPRRLPPPSHSHPQFSVLRRPQRQQNMDDVEILEERPLSRAHTHLHENSTRLQRSVTPYPNGANETIDLTGDDDDIVHMGTRPRPGVNLERPNVTGGAGTRSLAERAGALQNLLTASGRLERRVHNALATFGAGGIENGRANAIANRSNEEGHGQFGNAWMPLFDFHAVGFDLGLPGGNRPPTPDHEPPKAADKGFTRSPGEDEVVVCPKCGDELATGEGEAKQEVWVIKKCGHAYCGTCTHNRSKAAVTSSKGKGKAVDSFKHCVVEGCSAPATIKSMVQVFFG